MSCHDINARYKEVAAKRGIPGGVTPFGDPKKRSKRNEKKRNEKNTP